MNASVLRSFDAYAIAIRLVEAEMIDNMSKIAALVQASHDVLLHQIQKAAPTANTQKALVSLEQCTHQAKYNVENPDDIDSHMSWFLGDLQDAIEGLPNLAEALAA